MSKIIGGAGGGGGAPRAAVVAEDSLQSVSIIEFVDGISEGEIGGFATADPLESVFLDNTPVKNADGSLNFKGVSFDYRLGTQDQTYIPVGEMSADENAGAAIEMSVASEVTLATPVTRTVNSAIADAVRITLQVAALWSRDTETGDVNGTEVQVTVEVRASGGSFVDVPVVESVPIFTNFGLIEFQAGTRLEGPGLFKGKASSPYERSFNIKLAQYGVAPYDIRISRLTPEITDGTVANAITWKSYTELINAKLRYPNTAHARLSFDARHFSQVPKRGYLLKGIKVRVPGPAFYDPVARTYTGVDWDGTFVNAWTRCPAWIFYDLITDPRYGLGREVPEAFIDKWNLWAIAQRSDALVNNGFGSTEPRYSLDLYLQQDNDAKKIVQDIASSFDAMAFWHGGGVFVAQDSPKAVSALYTPANVIDGRFSYAGSARQMRYTVALVEWNDPDDFYRLSTEYVEDREGIERYGYREKKVAAIGATSRGQAHRAGKRLLLTSRMETDAISFAVGLSGLVNKPGDIIRVSDPLRHNGLRLAGRISAGATTTTIPLDAEVDLLSGQSYTLSIILPDGSTVIAPVTNAAGVTQSLTVFPALAQAPDHAAIWSLHSGAIPSKEYRVLWITENSTEKDGGFYELSAVAYNADKYAQIENGLQLQPIYKKPYANTNAVIPPSGVGVQEGTFLGLEGISRYLDIFWASTDPLLAHHVLTWSLDDGLETEVKVSANGYRIEPLKQGTYTIKVHAVNIAGAASSSITVQTLIGKFYEITAVSITNLQITGPGGNTFEGKNAEFKWATDADAVLGLQSSYGAGDGGQTPWFRDFKVDVYQAGNFLRTEYVTEATYTYSFERNIEDGGPFRAISITVAARDFYGNLSIDGSLAASNPAPTTFSNIALSEGLAQIFVEYYPPTDSDYAYTRVYASQTPGFVPDAAAGTGNLVFEGTDRVMAFPVDTTGTWYVKLQGVDDFGPYGLTYSSQLSTVVASVNVTAEVGTILEDPGRVGDVVVEADRFIIVQPSTHATPTAVFGVALVNGISKVGILGDLLIDGSIYGRSIAVGAVTADKITVTNLAAISADIGLVTAGTFRTNPLDTNYRVEMSDTGSFPLWYGTGAKTAGNALFAMDTFGNVEFKGNISGGTIDINSGEFVVDANGHVSMHSFGIYDDLGNAIMTSGSGAEWNYINGKPTSLIELNATDGGTLSTASSKASTAVAATNDMASDDVLSPVEKAAVRREWEAIAAEKGVIDAQADVYSITTEKTTYGNSFTALADYLNDGVTFASGVPIWINNASLSGSTTIVAATFRAKFNDYYAARVALIKKVTDVGNNANTTAADIGYTGDLDADKTSSAQYTPVQGWNLNGTLDGWAVNQASVVLNPSTVTVTSTGTDPQIRMTGLSVIGAENTLVRMRVKRIVGTSWQGTCYYGTSGHRYSASYKKTITNITVTNEFVVLEWDMSDLTTGDADWVDNTIIEIRFDLAAGGIGDAFEIDWIAVGSLSSLATMGATWGYDVGGQPADTVLLNEHTTAADIGYTGDLDATRNVFKGDWSTSTAYAIGDVVIDTLGYGWSSLTTHTSSANTTTGNIVPAYPTASNTNWSLYAVKGVDAITAIVSNEAHTFSATASGNIIAYTDSGTTIRVFEGSREVIYDAVGTTDGTWKVSVIPTNITTGSLTDSGDFLTVGQHSGVASGTDASSILYSITGKRFDGSDLNATAQQSFSKSKAGDTGAAGAAGAAGSAGPQGAIGETGADGATLYTWVAYADNVTGTTNFTTGAPTTQTYMGIANNKTSTTESTDPTDYSWGLITGSQGVKGDPGDDGVTTYTWFAYATNATGTTGFTTGAWTNQTYIGIASNKTTATESTTAADYSWSLIKGDAGSNGSDGSDGATGAQGPSVVVTSNIQTSFKSTDTTLDAGQADIIFIATPSGVSSPTYVWSQVGCQTAPTSSTSNTYTITAAQFGTAGSAKVQCTVNGVYKDEITVVRLETSTAAAGADITALNAALNTTNVGELTAAQVQSSSNTSFFTGFEVLEVSSLVEGAGSTFIENTLEKFSGSQSIEITTTAKDTVASGTVGGIYGFIDARTALYFAGKTIVVSVMAKTLNACSSFSVGYSTNEAGNSGWQEFTPTATWQEYRFTFSVALPLTNGGDYFGFQGDVDGTILIDSFFIAEYADATDYGQIAIDTLAAQDAAKAYADAQDIVAAVTSSAYADGIVDAEEARAIADAVDQADIARDAAIATAATDATNKANVAATTSDWVGVADKPTDTQLLNANTTPSDIGFTGDLNATLGADSSNLQSGVSANLLLNAGFSQGSTTRWTASAGTIVVEPLGVNLANWFPENGNALYVKQEVVAAAVSTGYHDIFSTDIPVIEGTRYEYQARLAGHRCEVKIFIYWLNEAGAAIDNSAFAIANSGSNGGKSLNDFDLVGAFDTAPAGAFSAKLAIRKIGTNADPINNTSYLFVTQPYLGIAGAGQTELSPWTTGAAGGYLSEKDSLDLLDVGFTGDSDANNTTLTSQLSDDSNLGGTAAWSGLVSRPTDTQLLNANTTAIDVGLGNVTDGADVTLTKLAGSGVNIASTRYSGFGSVLPTMVHFGNGTIAPSTTAFFGQHSLQLAATGIDNYVYLGASSGDYNISITPNKKWIVSAYVRCNLVSKGTHLFIKTSDTNHTSKSATTSGTVNTWSRVSWAIDLSANPSTTCLLRLDNEGGNGSIMQFDGIMIEQQVGSLTTPSAYSIPSGTDFIQISADTLVAENAAKAHAEAQDALAAIVANAYSDGVVSTEEARAIADATSKATAAELAAITAAAVDATTKSNAAATTSAWAGIANRPSDQQLLNTNTTPADIGYTGDLAATAGADFDADVTNIPYATIYNNDDAAALGFNPTFSDWTGTLPEGWSTWGSNLTKETSNVRVGKFAAKGIGAGLASGPGMTRIASFASSPLGPGTFFAGTVDMYLSARTSGLPGLLVRVYTNAALTTYKDTRVQPSTMAGVWQRLPWTARGLAGTPIYGIRIYLMASWSGFSSGVFTGTVLFDNLRFSLFDSSTDNTAITVNSDGTLSGAGAGGVTLSGIGFSGDSNATAGAAWNLNLVGKPTDTQLLNENTTANDVGLGNVNNTSDATVLSSAASDATSKANAAALTANWASVTSRPTNLLGLDSTANAKLVSIATGATVGATFGTDINGQITSGNISTYIASAAIGSAQIGTAAIGTAQIGTAAVTNAKIGDLAVDTLQIAGNAVTVPVGAYTAAGINVSDAAWVTVQSVAIYSIGSIPVSVFCAFGGASDLAIDCRMLRGGAVIASGSYGSMLNIIDTPTIGTHTYSLQGKMRTNFNATSITNRSIIAIGLKK